MILYILVSRVLIRRSPEEAGNSRPRVLSVVAPCVLCSPPSLRPSLPSIHPSIHPCMLSFPSGACTHTHTHTRARTNTHAHTGGHRQTGSSIYTHRETHTNEQEHDHDGCDDHDERRSGREGHRHGQGQHQERPKGRARESLKAGRATARRWEEDAASFQAGARRADEGVRYAPVACTARARERQTGRQTERELRCRTTVRGRGVTRVRNYSAKLRSAAASAPCVRVRLKLFH